MTKDDFLSLLVDEIQAREVKTREDGQNEYAGGEDAFGNFNRLSTRLDIPRNKVLMTYAHKHLDGIESFLKGHTSQREDVLGRIVDLRLYLALLYGMIVEDRLTIKNDTDETERQARLIEYLVDDKPYFVTGLSIAKD